MTARALRGLMASLLLAGAVAAAPELARCATWTIVGRSMEPALHHGQRVTVCPADTIRRGDIVIVDYVAREHPLCKRVIGVQGDTLDERLPVPTWTTWDTIPPGMLYLRADHRGLDSRRLGLASVDQVLGVVRPDAPPFPLPNTTE